MIEIVKRELQTYAEQHSEREPELLSEIVRETHLKTLAPEMLTGQIEGRFLKLLVSLSCSKKVLEIGTFTGYSALCIAEGLPDDGELITLEASAVNAKMAAKNFANSRHGKKIKLIIGPAAKTLDQISGPLDFVFIDADKQNYPLYYDRTIELLKPGGILLVDNALWSGEVLSPDNESSKAIDLLNKQILADSRVENVMLTIRDGINLVRKK